MTPTTPPRKRLGAWVTPPTRRKCLPHAGPDLKMASPFITHTDVKHTLDHGGKSSGSATLLFPTPQTSEAGKISKISLRRIPQRPSLKSRGLTAKLLSVADQEDVGQDVDLNICLDDDLNICLDDLKVDLQVVLDSDLNVDLDADLVPDNILEDSDDGPHDRSTETGHDADSSLADSILCEPFTPPSKPRIEQKPVFEPFIDSPNSGMITIPIGQLKNIPQQKPRNPFNLPSSLPNKSSAPSQIDYSTHLELVNNRTGERIAEELSDEQRRLRPRKLDFSQCETLPAKPNYIISNKFIENSLGPKFSMGNSSLAKNLAGFDIFSSPPS